ncbi:class B sortase (plasmid) [Paraclostridium ghonii]|uniref:class B sortase n=1 Tax=Paraclostridium ghonii TaxID=29358 RepID=UPI00202D0042|nr:class B sortase [Paeniclostridium ghonii]MCM0166748.1 class B sortase [Paeniclostridium ghonii]
MKKIKWILNLILLVILLFSSYKIINKFVQYSKADKVYEKINEIKESQQENPNKSIDLSYINKDYRGWLDVDGTNIHYPIVQTTNNDFYLDKDINKNYLESGSIFLDFQNDNFNDSNTILYGHSMRNGTMFGQLKKFKDEEFFNNYNNIYISKPDGSILKYKIFSAYITDSINIYNKPSFDSNEDFNSFLDKTKKDSLFKSPVNVDSNDKILTLSTCSYEFDNARMVVHAKLIQE